MAKKASRRSGANKPTPDPLIDEIRAIRKEIWDRCGNDLDRHFAELRELQERHGGKIIRRPLRQRSRARG